MPPTISLLSIFEYSPYISYQTLYHAHYMLTIHLIHLFGMTYHKACLVGHLSHDRRGECACHIISWVAYQTVRTG